MAKLRLLKKKRRGRRPAAAGCAGGHAHAVDLDLPDSDRVIKFLDGKMEELTEELKGISHLGLYGWERPLLGEHRTFGLGRCISPQMAADRAPGVHPHLIFCLSLPPPSPFFPRAYTGSAELDEREGREAGRTQSSAGHPCACAHDSCGRCRLPRRRRPRRAGPADAAARRGL